MKTIVTNPPTAAQDNLGFIKDPPFAKPAGKDIGALVAGKPERLTENEDSRKTVAPRGRSNPRGRSL